MEEQRSIGACPSLTLNVGGLGIGTPQWITIDWVSLYCVGIMVLLEPAWSSSVDLY